MSLLEQLNKSRIASTYSDNITVLTKDFNSLVKSKDNLEKSGMDKTMEEFKAGTLKTPDGKVVTDRKQAIAIGLSEDEKMEKSKGGEGSKGGKVIGHTKSGKAIYDQHDHPEHKDFTKEDHKDAADIHYDKSRKTDKSGTEGNVGSGTESARHFESHKQHLKSAEEKEKGEHDHSVIATTQSGKSIDSKLDHDDYTTEDHSDAVIAHQNEAKKHFEDYKTHTQTAHIKQKEGKTGEASEFGKRADESRDKSEHHSSMAHLHHTAMMSKYDKPKEEKVDHKKQAAFHQAQAIQEGLKGNEQAAKEHNDKFLHHHLKSLEKSGDADVSGDDTM